MLNTSFNIKQPSALSKPWMLSPYKDQRLVAVSQEATKHLKIHHLPGIDFLYQNYKKNFKGAILNEEDGLDMQLQVSAFLNAMINCTNHKFLVLILCPDYLLVKWHYHLTVNGGLKVIVIESSTCPEEFDREHGIALLISFSNIKLLEPLVDYDYFSVVIDCFDEAASKRVVNKLYGEFKIGLSGRNFYIKPDQKLQWTMLNWSNPGCVGKLSDFYKIDSDNFANYRDNYRHWWFRLTWNFCETFERISAEEEEEYAKMLSKWSSDNQLTQPVKQKKKPQKHKRSSEQKIRPGTKQNQDEILQYLNNNHNDSNRVTECNISNDLIDEHNQQQQTVKDELSSGWENTTNSKFDSDNKKYIPLPSMDENPILDSIIKNFNRSPVDNLVVHNPKLERIDKSQPNQMKSFEDDGVLMSIINNTNEHASSPIMMHQAQVLYEKAEILSQFVDDKACSSKSCCYSDEESDFLLSLVESNPFTKNVDFKRTDSD